jgi:hypothetical protein
MNPARRRTKGRGKTVRKSHRRGVFMLKELQEWVAVQVASAQTSLRAVPGVSEIAVTPRIFNIIGLA